MLASRFETEQAETDFKAALSDMYQVAGLASHDLGDHAAARHYLTVGLVLAREINELALIAGGFYRLGRVSIHQGRAQEALRLWQLGQIVAQDSGNRAAVAVLHANTAWAYAMLGVLAAQHLPPCRDHRSSGGDGAGGQAGGRGAVGHLEVAAAAHRPQCQGRLRQSGADEPPQLVRGARLDQAVPGEAQIFAPQDVPGATIPSAENDG